MKLAFNTTNINGLHPALESKLAALDDLWKEQAGYQLTITHGLDGRHSRFSRHYWGGAIDIRTHTTPNSWIQFSGNKRTGLFTSIVNLLGTHFSVLDEGTHFHLSLKPDHVAWTKIV